MPNWFGSLLLGVVSSLIAAVLAVGVAGLVSKTARWILTGVLGRLLDIDIEVVFINPRDAAIDIKEELSTSRDIRLMTGRGSELQRETFSDLFASFSKESTPRRLRILLPSLDPQHQEWLLRREAEVSAFDSAYGKGLLGAQIAATWKFLGNLERRHGIFVKGYDFMHIGRILVTDSCAYLTPYTGDSHSRSSRVIKYRRGGEMYTLLARIFDELWESSDGSR